MTSSKIAYIQSSSIRVSRIGIVVLGLATLSLQSLNAAPPSVVGNDFEAVFGEDSTVDGPLGGSTLTFQVHFSFDTNRTTIQASDLLCEGTSGDALGKTIPIELDFTFQNFQESVQTGVFTIGPFDPTANGGYSLKVLENSIFNGLSEALPAGELLAFTQDVRDPAPAVLGVRFDPPLVGGNLEGPLGFERPSMFVDFNTDVSSGFISSSGIEILGTNGNSGQTIPTAVNYPVTVLEDKITVEFLLGPMDVALNGPFSVSVKENVFRGVGDVETYVPAGEIASFTQSITNPPPRLLTELNGLPLGGFPTAIDYEGYAIRLYFNYAVDPQSIDENDIRVVGKSENNLGEELTVLGTNSFEQNFPSNDAYLVATYSVVAADDPEAPFPVGSLKEELNGEWEIQIVEGEVLDREDPPRSLPAQVVGTFIQDVIDPFETKLTGRIFEETGTPSLNDDGYEIDPGLMMSINVENLENGGMGYQDLQIAVESSKGSFTGLCFPVKISESSIGDGPLERVFELPGDFQVFISSGDQFIVEGSTGNDGTYTVSSIDTIVEGETSRMFIFVSESIPSDVSDGKFYKSATYTGRITIDGGTPIDLVIEAVNAGTFEALLDAINAQLGDAGTAFLQNNFVLRFESATFGSGSSVLIDDTASSNNLFACLQGFGATQPFLDEPSTGSDEWVDSFSAFDETYLLVGDFASEEDYGLFQFRIIAPGRYRIQAGLGKVYDPETDTFNWITPYPEWVVQTLGDPSREGDPKDHYMYFDLTRDQTGSMILKNFSYVQETDSPEAIEDDAEVNLAFRVPWNSVAYQLDVLANDTVNGQPVQNGNLTIIGLGPDLALSEETESKGSREFSTIGTDGDFVYYTPIPGFTGWELFYYTVEDNEGKRDFAPVYILVTSGPIEAQVFTIDDHFEALPGSANNVLGVLDNDFVNPPGNNSPLMITGLGTTQGSTDLTATGSDGGTISTSDGRTVVYTPLPDFQGNETFFYNVSDGDEGTGFAKVTVSVIPEGVEVEPVIRSYFSEFITLLRQTAVGRRLLGIAEEHEMEVTGIVVGNPEIGSEAASLAAKLGIEIMSSDRFKTLETQIGSGGEIMETFEMLKGGAAAFLNGSGSEVMLTQQMADQVAGLRDLIRAEASDELKADIDAEFGNIENQVGQNLNQVLETYGANADDVEFRVFDPSRTGDEFSVVVNDLESFDFYLWKTTTLDGSDWALVEDATITYFPSIAIIADPNPGNGKAFYRLERRLQATE